MSTLFFRAMVSLALILLFSPSTYARDLRIGSGETYMLAGGEKLLDLDTLILEDGASIIIANGESAVMIRARRVEIGTDVKIIGRGADGLDGDAGQNYDDFAKNCEAPNAGESGEEGKAGGDGVNLNLDWVIASFGSVTVDLSGGNGGDGGVGGDGQSADQNKNCELFNGGDAGAGGAAGEAGSGGNLTYRYSGMDDDAQAFFAREHTLIESGGGVAGQPGAAGEPGIGSPGRYIVKKSLAGSRSWLAGGELGKKPKALTRPKNGQNGTSTFQLKAVNMSGNSSREVALSIKPSIASKPIDYKEPLLARIEALEAEVKRLSERLIALEHAK